MLAEAGLEARGQSILNLCDRARELVQERLSEEKLFVSEPTHEAACTLLRAHSGYNDHPELGVGGLASFKQGNVSLPASSAGAPLLRSLVSDKASEYLDDFSSMLNNSDDLAAAGSSSGEVQSLRAYQDLATALSVSSEQGRVLVPSRGGEPPALGRTPASAQRSRRRVRAREFPAVAATIL